MLAQSAGQPLQSFAFGTFVLIPGKHLLLENDGPVRIGGRALDILTVLVKRPGELVSKQELMSQVWPKLVVEEANLKVNMATLRRVLGGTGGEAQYIATVVGRGYRFVAPVRTFNSSDPAPSSHGPALRKHNLPLSATRILGRDDVIAAIRQELFESRLVSIVGPGGIGKTTVALAVADQMVGAYRDGIWIVELAPLKDPSLVPNAIATATGLAAHSANMLAALSEYLRDREMLLLLDSCEHVIDAVAAAASRILAEAPAIKVLLTTREPLRLRGERVRRLAMLEVPVVTGGLTAQQALTFPAVQLFVDRATDRLESFALDDANAPMIGEICRKLDGLALAIELAATRIDAFGVSELLRQLDDRLGLLKGHRAAAERHRTLAATIDWSYELLSASERTLLRRLAVFAGGFTLASACAVAADEKSARAQVVDDLASLVAKSLVTPEERDAGMEYRLLDTTRSYAMEKLATGQEMVPTRQRHAKHFLDVAEEAGAQVDALPRDTWLSRHVGRIGDVRDALAWTFGDGADAALGMALTVATIPFWEQLSLLEECRIAVERALEARFDANRDAGQSCTLLLALGASVLYTRGPLPEVKAALEKALELAEQAGDSRTQLECLRGLSEYDLWTGHARSALTVADRIRGVAAARGDAKSGDNADAQAGSALRYLGNLAASQEHLENIVGRPVRQAASRFEFDQYVAALGSLAAVLWLRGFPEQAIAMAIRQRKEAEASHHAVPLSSAIVHTTLGIASFVGDQQWADELMHFIEKHTVDHHLDVWQAMATCARGRWLLDRSEPFELEGFRRAMAQLQERGLRMRYPSMLANLGEGLAQQGDFKGALGSFEKSLDESQRSGQLWGMSEILRMKGNALRKQAAPGFRAAATDCYQESLRWAREQGALSWELRTATSLVDLCREEGDVAQSEQMLADTYARFTEGFATRDLRVARERLEQRRDTK